jgi:alpha-glucoside transport system substrate-binding protein
VEALVLRVGGVELYDRWVDHDVGFEDPAIAQAVSMFGQVVFGDRFLRGSTQSAARANIFEAHDPMLDEPPGCWMSHMPSFFDELAREDAVAGVDYDFFVLPPLRRGGPAPMFGDAGLVSAVSDRPEVREFLRQTMDPDAIPTWAASARDLFMPAHAGFDSQRCASPDQPAEANALRVRMCEAARASVADDVFRLDASDVMPEEIGLPAPPGERGAFLQGMADYVVEGPDSLEAVLRRIDAAWPREREDPARAP